MSLSSRAPQRGEVGEEEEVAEGLNGQERRVGHQGKEAGSLLFGCHLHAYYVKCPSPLRQRRNVHFKTWIPHVSTKKINKHSKTCRLEKSWATFLYMKYCTIMSIV